MTHIANIFRKKSSETHSFEKELKQATSNKDASVPHKIFMDISSHSSNYKDLDKIVKRIWRVLDAGNKRKWRKIGKTLNLVDHLLKYGSFQCVEEFRDKKDKIVNFQQFYYFEGGSDRGFAIREQSDKIVDLLNNRDILAEQRDLAQQLSGSLQEHHAAGSKLAHSASLKPSSTAFNKENENITSTTSHMSKPTPNITKSNPFQTTIPPPPENPLAFNRSKSNPVSIDLLGLDTPSTNVVPNENENKKQTANPQPNPDLINDNVAYLLEKKESSESSEEEAHSHSHSDLDVEDQEFESIGYSHLNSRHQKKRDTKIRVSAEDIDLFDQDIQSPTIPENQHSPVFSNLNNKNPFIQANEIAERPKMERKTSFNNPFRTDYTPNSNFNNPFRPKGSPMEITKNASSPNMNNNANENINPNVLSTMQNGGGKSLPANQMIQKQQQQQEGPILSSSEDLDQLALEFASKTPTTKTNLLSSGSGQSHDEHDDIYMSNPALVSRASCPGSMGFQGNYSNPFNAGMKPCKNNPFAPKLL